jgi:hypothetical protein
MSWLSDLTHVHIGSGPKPPKDLPAEYAAAHPDVAAQWKQMQDVIKQGAKVNTGAEIAAGTALGGVALSGLGGAAVPGAGGMIEQNGITGVPAAGAIGGGSTGGGISLGSILGGLPGAIGKIGGFIGDHPGLVDTGLGGLAALNAANLSKQSTQYAKNAMDTSNQSYDSRAPLRLAGIQAMLHPQPTSGPIQQVSGNPFSPKPLPLSQVG